MRAEIIQHPIEFTQEEIPSKFNLILPRHWAVALVWSLDLSPLGLKSVVYENCKI